MPRRQENGCREKTWTLKQWKWTGCVSAVTLKMRHVSTVPSVTTSVGVSDQAHR